ncbi:T9SS type A sorting domain-containing protein, partial [Schleiferiaceae bacterium]|nr:T9SS type A sorting domain-containing protein [Schleiferiaceae bacterium]
VAAVYDPTANKKISLYVDGVVCGTGNFTATPATTAGNLVIGRRVDGANPFGGDIDEFRLWNIALTDSDVQAHMNGEICAPPNNLVLYYTMNGGVADGNNTNTTTLADQSGSNNGTLQNFSLSGSSSNWTYGQNLSQTAFDTVVAAVCEKYPIPDGSGYWDSTGTYNWTFTQGTGAVSGCDSVVTYELTIDTVDTRTSENGIVLSALATNATYQWVNCSDSSLINGATSATYVVTTNGDYAVKVTQGICSAWSDCISITTVGLEENTSNWTIYPNPTSGEFFIAGAPSLREVALYDLNGRLLQTLAVTESWVELPENLRAGFYIVRNVELGLSALISVQ